MNIRTISDLSEAKTLSDEDLIEVSKSAGSNKFTSNKHKVGKLREDIVNKSILKWSQDYNLPKGSDLGAAYSFTRELSGSVSQLSGVVTFNKQPRLKQQPDVNNDDLGLQTRKQVCDLIDKRSGSFIGPGTYVKCEPLNDQGNTQDYEYYWKIEGGQYDSSLALDEEGFRIGPVQVRDTGWLVMYGWLASSDDVLPQNAWVGLYGLFDDDETWKLVQMQPWIMGRYSQQMQYVGFGLPVRAGARFKVMTGFPVNGSVSGYQTYSHTLLLTPQRGNIINSFVGYVVTSKPEL